MSSSRKARARRALRYYQHLRNLPLTQGTGPHYFTYKLPPSIAIAIAHNINPRTFPLMARRQWKKAYA